MSTENSIFQALFALSDGIDGSALSYTLVYNNSVSGNGCGSAIISASSCVDQLCRHSFTYEESVSDCTLLKMGCCLSTPCL